MPSHKVHRYITKVMLGHPLTEVHRAIDRPYMVFGRSHRRWFHTPSEAAYMGMIATFDPRGASAGWLHAWTDKKCSEDKEFKQLLEMMANHNEKMERALKKLQSKKRRR